MAANSRVRALAEEQFVKTKLPDYLLADICRHLEQAIMQAIREFASEPTPGMQLAGYSEHMTNTQNYRIESHIFTAMAKRRLVEMTGEGE